MKCSNFNNFCHSEPSLTKVSQLSYDKNKINDNNLTSKIGNELLETSLDCHETSIQQIEVVSFGEKDKKTSIGYAETSLDEATNYSLLCEEEDNGEKALTGDTTQTYCTEGTPYNFSNAASYTDLRKCGIEDKVIIIISHFSYFVLRGRHTNNFQGVLYGKFLPNFTKY